MGFSGIKNKRFNKILYKWLGGFDELSLFNLSIVLIIVLVLILLIAFYQGTIVAVTLWSLYFIIFLVILVFGLIQSIRFAFSEKTVFESDTLTKSFMGFYGLFFSVVLSGFSAIFIIISLQGGAFFLLVLFPVYSLLKAFTIFLMLREDLIKTEKVIQSGNATLFQLVVCTVVILVSFYFLHFLNFGFQGMVNNFNIRIIIVNASISLGIVQLVEVLFKKFKPLTIQTKK